MVKYENQDAQNSIRRLDSPQISQQHINPEAQAFRQHCRPKGMDHEDGTAPE
jgi:hypothetical protein